MNIKEYTREAHDRIEKTAVARSLVHGTIDRPLYDLYLSQRYHITSLLEALLDLPEGLRRAELMRKDIETFHEPLPATRAYMERLEATDKDQLTGDVYVNYLGDLFGGQWIAKRISHPASHLKFDDPDACISYVRNMLGDPSQAVKSQAVAAFESLTEIFNEIYRRS